jgi:hypothetical protein
VVSSPEFFGFRVRDLGVRLPIFESRVFIEN